MSTLTAKQQSFIMMMKTDPELAPKGFRLLQQRADYVHFFDPLRDAGFFAPTANPAAAPGQRENTVYIPYWPALDYLKAVAEYAGTSNDLPVANKIMNVVRSVSAWRDDKGEPRRNYHTNRIFATILGLVPTNTVTLSDVDLLGEWLNDPYDRMLVADALHKGVFPRFLGSSSSEDWKKAARVFHHVMAINWHKDGDETEPTPLSVVDDYWLELIIKSHAKQIGEKTGEYATETMIGRVREVFSTPLRRDHSSAFRPAVEDDPQNHQFRSVENRVVEGLRDVVLGWVGGNPNDARAIVQTMLNDGLEIIRRVGIHVLGEHWTSMSDLYSVVTGPAFFNDGHGHELYHLLQDHFADMSPEQQAATMGAIETLPTPTYGDDPGRLRRLSQYRWLSAIKRKGYVPADERFAELDADQTIGKLGDHPDFDSYITSWVGPGPTPYSPEELIAFTKANVLVAKLNTFTPRDYWQGPTIDGLTSALEAAARTNPDLFLDSLSQLLVAKPIYQHATINGLKQAWESRAGADWVHGWKQLIHFFELLSNRQDFWQQTEDVHQHWVVSAIADCLHAGTRNDEQAYDAILLPRTQAVIAVLLQHEHSAERAEDDAMMQALNTPKGRIVEALYSQALRAARVSDQKGGTHQEAWEAIRPLFETELAKCKNANYEFSTLCGTYLPQLQYLDIEWTTDHANEIFPATYRANMACALDGLAYASFTRTVYELLAAHGIIDRALSLELKGRSGREKLLERIGAAYLWGLETIDGQCLKRVFDTATVDDLSVLARVFWVVRNDNLTPEQRERILTFWVRTLEWAHHQSQIPSRLLSTLSLLTTHITTIGSRERHLLDSAAPNVHVGHESYEFVAELLRLAPQDPGAITEVLRSMLTAQLPDYDYEDKLRSLLEFLAKHGQREAVIVMTDRLRHLQGIEAVFKSLT